MMIILSQFTVTFQPCNIHTHTNKVYKSFLPILHSESFPQLPNVTHRGVSGFGKVFGRSHALPLYNFLTQ